MPDEKWGKVPCAFVELKAGETVETAEFNVWCRGQMAGFKRPKHVVFGDLPKTSTGKIQKFVLRQKVKDMPNGKQFWALRLPLTHVESQTVFINHRVSITIHMQAKTQKS